MESKLVVDLDEGEREWGCVFRTKPTSPPSLLEQRCGKAKGGLGVGGGWMDGGQKRRAGKAGELKSRDGDCLQMNQATALSRSLSHTSKLAAAPAPLPPLQRHCSPSAS
uniref:Uncharacterized protein n=1 Tax=Setaria italica TaxID=4555 RepID=K3Z1D4_SETIT